MNQFQDTPQSTASEELSEITMRTNKKTLSTTPLKEGFDPSNTFYFSLNGSYIVDVGKHYRSYTRKTPVIAGIKRFIDLHRTNDELDEIMERIELDQAVDWQGSIAGYQRGLHDINGKSFLVMDEPVLIDSAEGVTPLLNSIISQAFPDGDARAVFLSWLRDGVLAVRKSHHHPAPMLVMAGERKAGKSLIAFIVQQCLGGRASNPMKTWNGKTLWNDDLLRAELLLIDDSEASTDIRARRNLGANFKESIYGGNIKIQSRGKTAMDMRPVWRVMICCNETPENLAVIPPLEEGIEDKIILLKVKKIETPMPAQSVDEKEAFSQALKDELPAFIHNLLSIETPDHLQDNRDGVTAWKDPELLAAINELSPEHRLECLLSLALDKGVMNLDRGKSKYMSAAEIHALLTNRDSHTYEQARGLLSHSSACGRILSSLVRGSSQIITNTKVSNGIANYEITRPPVE